MEQFPAQAVCDGRSPDPLLDWQAEDWRESRSMSVRLSQFV
ncbi:hypothetical protein [Thermoleptolyngbya sichuanensis]|nr:hypothetical protein [Thermoleptolyngbya sichuanensis]